MLNGATNNLRFLHFRIFNFNEFKDEASEENQEINAYTMNIQQSYPNILKVIHHLQLFIIHSYLQLFIILKLQY